MSEATFRGGVHPYEGKELSCELPIKNVTPKGDMVFPMSQHIGAPATPIVAKGDKVLVGQKIGEASGFISANICSSVSGTVKAIEKRRVVTGDSIDSIIRFIYLVFVYVKPVEEAHSERYVSRSSREPNVRNQKKR